MPAAKPVTWEVDEETGCWNCTSHARDKDGYIIYHRKGKKSFMHRVRYQHHHGPLPREVFVRHKCDNPSCINLDHLEAGTHTDNMRDMSQRGRSVRGERSAKAKLTEDAVRQILRDNGSAEDLGKRYGVTKYAIWQIRSGRTWGHLQRGVVA